MSQEQKSVLIGEYMDKLHISSITVDELRVISDMTVKLVEIRQNECKHLHIENFAPELFHELLTRLQMSKNGMMCVSINKNTVKE
jgi:hypothetical protein